MRKLSSPQDLLEYCLRALGKPVINIEVADEQAYDRIDDAIQWFILNHHAGTTEQFVRITFTEADEIRQSIKMPERVVAITEIIDPGSNSGAGDEFDRLNYLVAQSDYFDFMGKNGRNYDLLSYEVTLQYISLLNYYFQVRRAFTHDKIGGQLYIPSGRITAGNFIIIRAYLSVDETKAPDIYNDEWLKKYSKALIKMQWGENLKKFEGVQMVGGITLNGQKIWDEAQEEVTKLRDEFTSRYTLPFGVIWG